LPARSSFSRMARYLPISPGFPVKGLMDAFANTVT